MIYTTVDLTIGSEKTIANRQVILYRGDKNVEIRFTLKGNIFTVLDNMFAQLIIRRPSAASLFSDVAPIENNVVVLTVTEEMIDEFKEAGEYAFQIRLYDDNLNARVTLPPVENGLVIKQPIAVEGESLVNYARVNAAVLFSANSNEESEDTFNEDRIYNRTVWEDGDLITDTRMNKIEDALYYLSKDGGGGSGGGATAPYISTELSENIMVGTDEDFILNIDFNSPNYGNGTLKVFINDVDSYSTKIYQGTSSVTIPGSLFTKGTNQVVVYVLDRVGVMSNSLTFYVRYGGLELTSTFDPYMAYDIGSNIRYYFTPTSLDTSVPLIFYMEIDGTIQNGVECVSDVRSFFMFPSDLDAGKHYCRAWITDDTTNSNVIEFNLVILDTNTLVIASDTKSITAEEGSKIEIDYKVYNKNESSFVTKIYLDGDLISTGTCNLETNYYRTNSIPEGSHILKIEVSDTNNTISDYISWSITITPSQYEMLEPVTTGSVFIATAKNKSNTDEDKTEWVGTNQDNESIRCNLNNFAYSGDNGWVNDELVISGESYVEVPIAPLSNNAKYGFTLDIEFSTKPIGVENAEVLRLWNEEKDCGIRITTEELIFKSVENECHLYFSEDEIISAMFIIDRNEKTAKIYLNGVMCTAFVLTDYTANGVLYLEDFQVNSNVILGGKDSNGYCKIRNLRIYDVALNTSEILNNWMSNITDKQEQRDMVNFQKGETLPTLTVYCDFSGLGKDDKKPCDIVYNSPDETLYGKSFNLTGKYSMLQYQGTSSMGYPIKNYRLNPRDESGKVKLDPFNNGVSESRFTLKADFMSCGHWQNTGLARWVNDNLYNYNENDEKSMNPFKWYQIQNGGTLKDSRECINGFPCRLILINDGSTPLNEGQQEPTPGNTKDMGVFNFNNDKDNVKTLGFDRDIFPYCASYEVVANSDTSAGAFVSYSGTDSAEELSYLQNSFELRFPDEDDVGSDYGYLNMDGDATKGLKRLIDWVDNCTDEEFVNDFDNYFHRDYTLRYYILVIVLAMVDNLGKNMMLDTADGQIWFPRFYDMDTICSYDNSGAIKFDTDVEMEQGYWNTSASRLWTRIRDLMHSELVDKYKSMRQNGLSYESFMSYFYDKQIKQIPQTYYNKDYDIKYAPYADEFMGKAHGDGYEHLKRWLKRRIIFTDSLFDYAPAYTNDMLTIRANTEQLMTLEIETYVPVYLHLSWYNGQMDKKKVDGKTSTIFTGTAQTSTDQEVLIYGGSNIKRIKGINTMNPDSMLIGNATRLMELECTDAKLLTEINSNKANLSANSYLSKVDLSGCSNLGGTLRINNSQLLQELNISGTAIDNIVFPTSLKNLKILKLPNTISNLSISNTSLLKDIIFDEGYKLDKLELTNCKGIDGTQFNFKDMTTLTIDNSLEDILEIVTRDITNLTLKNMPNIERIIYIPNDEYEVFSLDKFNTAKDYIIKASNCQNLNDFITTAPQRLSYPEIDDVISPNKVFISNFLDLSTSTFKNIKLLCTTDLSKLKLPVTVENFYCDSAFDLDTSVITDGAYDTIHGELIEPYTTDYTDNVLLNDVTPNIVPSSANGSLIYNVWSESGTQPSSTYPYIWDLTGLKFKDFHTYGINNWVKVNSEDNTITMPKRTDGYAVRIQNADITPANYNTMLYPLFIDTTLPITGKIDYFYYKGNNLSWAYAYTTDAITINPLPSGYLNRISYDYNKLYNTDFIDVVDAWIFKDTDCSTLVQNDTITKIFIELTSDNYKTRVNDVLGYYPNGINIYFFDDGSVTSLQFMFKNSSNNYTYIDQVLNIEFLESYFVNLIDLSYFSDSFYLESVNNIPDTVEDMTYAFQCNNLKYVGNFPKNIKKLTSAFYYCKSLKTIPEFPEGNTINLHRCFFGCNKLNQKIDLSKNHVTDLQYAFCDCYALSEMPILPDDYSGSLYYTFASTYISEVQTLPKDVYSISSAFKYCDWLRTVNDIPEKCENFSSAFYDCPMLTSVPKTGWKGNLSSTFEECYRFNQEIEIISPTNLNKTFSGCDNLNILPKITFNSDIDIQFIFSKTSITTPFVFPNTITKYRYVYSDCKQLETCPKIPDTITDISGILSGCLLEEVEIPLTVESYSYALARATNIKNIIWKGTRTTDFSLSTLGCPSYTESNVKDLVNNHLGEVESATLTLGSTYLAYLTDEEIAAAVAKGWTLE